jgi:hypothetical protein
VVIEDIAETRGAQFISATTPVTREQVADLVGTLAAVHGAFWEHNAIGALKTPREHLRNVSSLVNMAARAKVGMEQSKSVIPPTLYGQPERLWKGTQRALEMATSWLPATLLHGDCHIGQTYITGDGSMGLTDWQIIQQGGWALDFAYLVGSGLRTPRPPRLGRTTAAPLPGATRRRRRQSPHLRRGLAGLPPTTVLPLLRLGLRHRSRVLPTQDAARHRQPQNRPPPHHRHRRPQLLRRHRHLSVGLTDGTD